MTFSGPIRSLQQAAYRAVLGLLCLSASAGGAVSAQAQAPIERRPPSAAEPPGTVQLRGPRGEHLAEWMNQHSNLSPQEQQQALQHEPGFQQLSRTTQQRMLDRLAQLDAMTPEKRARVLAHTEAMERLNMDQRAEVRGAMAQLGSLPMPERRQVAQTFRALRELPPEQRVQAYTTGRYGPALADNQRAVLFNLLRVEPLLEPMPAATRPQALPPAQAFH